VSPAVTDGLGAGDNDEPAGDLPAPLPLHERSWIHPSELGAIRAAEVARAGDTVKRASILVAVASVVLSLLFIQVVHPSRRPAPRARAFVTVAASNTSGTSGPDQTELVGSVTATGAPVATLGDGSVAVTPSGQGEPGSEVSMSFGGVIVLATVLDWENEFGLQMLSIPTNGDPPVEGAPFVPPVAGAAPAPGRGDAVTVVGANDTVSTATIGIASGALHPLLPVDPGHDHPDGGGPAFDADGRMCGWVVEVNGAYLLVPVAELLAAVPRLAADAGQP
jgi:hypothetical protein